MYLLDTNIVSAIRRGNPESVSWLRSTAPSTHFLSVISFGEIEKGIAQARLRDETFALRLSEWLTLLRSEFADRALPVDIEIATRWGAIAAGRSRGMADALIAATASVHRLTLVTRNVRDFADLDIPLVNPWDAD